MTFETPTILPPPPETPEQAATRVERGLDAIELQVRSAEIAKSIIDSAPDFEATTPRAPIPAEQVSPPPERVVLTSADFPPAAEVTEPFAPTRESVAAEEQRQAERVASAAQTVEDAQRLNDEAVRLGIIPPPAA